MSLRLEMTGVAKSYPGARALAGASLTLAAGEVLAVVGENGAGKSTLIKLLSGAVMPDTGTIRIDGEEMPGGDPAEARRRGVSVIYQEFNLVPGLTAAENVYLGREPRRFGWLNRKAIRNGARKLFEQLGVVIDPDTPVSGLTIAQQQAVEIAKALVDEAKVLVLDEPTAALTPVEAERLFAVVKGLAARGVGVIYISHRLEEVFALANRVMVLRDGEQVMTKPIGEVNRQELIEAMVGRTLDQEFPERSRHTPCAVPRFEVNHLSQGIVNDVSFQIGRGEVLGLTGLVGSGRTEVLRLLFGADRRDAGTITLDGRPIHINSPRDAIRAGIALLTEDRKAQGLILEHSVRENYALPNLGLWSRLGLLGRRQEQVAFHSISQQVKLKATPRAKAATLSGGNQQKVVLAKWLERNCEVILFDEPTRGIDVGAKYEIYCLIRSLAAQGKAILIVSSELPEVLGLADRILVMHAGRIAGELPAGALQQDILHLAMGPAA